MPTAFCPTAAAAPRSCSFNSVSAPTASSSDTCCPAPLQTSPFKETWLAFKPFPTVAAVGLADPTTPPPPPLSKYCSCPGSPGSYTAWNLCGTFESEQNHRSHNFSWPPSCSSTVVHNSTATEMQSLLEPGGGGGSMSVQCHWGASVSICR